MPRRGVRQAIATALLISVLVLPWAPGRAESGGKPEEAGASVAVDIDRARDLVTAVFEADAYETELPVIVPDLPDPPRERLDPGTPVDLGWLMDVFLVLFIGFVVVVVVLELRRRFWNRTPETVDGSNAPRRDAPTVPVSPADAAAAEGRWAEAIHLLLLSALAVLTKRRPIAAAVTGRESPDVLELTADRHTALSHLVAETERGLFAGHSLDAETYRACRASHDLLTAGRPA